MSWRRVSKDIAHPPTVDCLLAGGAQRGILVLEVNASRWGPALTPVGATPKKPTLEGGGGSDLLVLFAGRWVALEIKTPGINKSSRQRKREERQVAFREAVRRLGAEAFEVHGPLEASAAVGFTSVEARRGLVAAEYAGRSGGMGHALPAESGDLRTHELEAMLSEARQRLQAAAAPEPTRGRAVVRTHDGAPPKKR